MSCALCPNPTNAYFSAIGDGSRFFVICYLKNSGQMFSFQTPGRRPPYITGLRVNFVTLRSVGAPNERAPLIVHAAIAVFAVRCLTTQIADQGLGGFDEHCAGFTRAIKFRVCCPGEFKICRGFRRNSSLQAAWDGSIARLLVFIFYEAQGISYRLLKKKRIKY